MRNWLLLTLLVMVLSACIKEPNIPHNSLKTTPRYTDITPTEVPSTATQNPTETATRTATATEQPTATKEELAGVDIFDTSTFPDEYKGIAENPASSTEEQQNEYQDFLHRARQKFFTDKGILGLVNQFETSGKIDPEVADIWGMMYAQQNPDKLKDPNLVEDKRIVLGPAELRKMYSLWDANLFEKWTESIKKNGELFETDYGENGIDTIDTKNTSLKIFGIDAPNRYYGSTIDGVIGGIASDGSPNSLIVLIQMKDPKSKWEIAPLLVGNDPLFALPKGSVCRQDGGGWFTIPESVPYGPIADVFSKQIPEIELFVSLGLRIMVNPYSDLFESWAQSKPELAPLGVHACFIDGVFVTRQTVIFPAYKPPVWDSIDLNQ